MNLTTWFAFSIIIIVLFALISNSSTTGLANINSQFLRLACPFPLNSAVATNVNSNGVSVTYNVTHDTSSSDYHVTVFHCAEDTPTSVTTTVYTTANNWFNIGLGYLFYLSETVSNLFIKLLAVFTLLSYVLTPINFNILGHTITEIGGLALMFVIALYIFCYIGIGVFLYKAILPTGGVS